MIVLVAFEVLEKRKGSFCEIISGLVLCVLEKIKGFFFDFHC